MIKSLEEVKNLVKRKLVPTTDDICGWNEYALFLPKTLRIAADEMSSVEVLKTVDLINGCYGVETAAFFTKDEPTLVIHPN